MMDTSSGKPIVLGDEAKQSAKRFLEGRFPQTCIAPDEDPHQTENPIITVLRYYSESKISCSEAMGALGLICAEDLMASTLHAGFDLPKSKEMSEATSSILDDLLKGEPRPQ